MASARNDRARKVNLVVAWAWFAFGMIGLADYLWFSGLIANSIPVLFGISVYANFVGHLGAAEAAHD